MRCRSRAAAGLERRMTVRVPTAEIERAIAARLAQVGKTAKLKGFRPGKVPKKVVRQYYGGQVRDEVHDGRDPYDLFACDRRAQAQPGGRSADRAFGRRRRRRAFRLSRDLRGVSRDRACTARRARGRGADRLDRGWRPRCHDREAARPARDVEGRRAQAAEGDRVGVDFSRHVDGEPFEGGEGKEHLDRASARGRS